MVQQQRYSWSIGSIGLRAVVASLQAWPDDETIRTRSYAVHDPFFHVKNGRVNN
jgi:hypothetical protein